MVQYYVYSSLQVISIISDQSYSDQCFSDVESSVSLFYNYPVIQSLKLYYDTLWLSVWYCFTLPKLVIRKEGYSKPVGTVNHTVDRQLIVPLFDLN